MADEDLRERAAALRAEVFGLLQGEFGDALEALLPPVQIAGSVALDLMVWRDLDLYVQCEPEDTHLLLEAVPHLTAALASQGHPVTRITYRDEHLEPDPTFPDMPGLYLGLVTATGWKVDLWGWDAGRYPAQHQRHRDLAEALASADRDLVLRLKDALWQRPDYRSMEVYEFVLAHAGDSLEDFEAYRAR